MFLKSLTLTNVLSFGSNAHTVELGPLNVIIGPNGSGKSNFLDVIELLQAAPRDIREPIRNGGGVDEWLWKGAETQSTATLEAVTSDLFNSKDVHYGLNFNAVFSRFEIVYETVFTVSDGKALILAEVRDGKIVLEDHQSDKSTTGLKYDSNSSLFSQIRKPFDRFEVGYLAQTFADFSVYREFDVSRSAPARMPQRADLPNDHLLPNASNLGLIINRLRRDSSTRQRLKGILQKLYEPLDDVDVQVEGGSVQVFAYEGRMAIPATRLSSGTLRFLCLLAILCDPKPSALICLEEPELGLHPDIIPTVADLLKEASTRTQVVVTTHSDILVDAMTDQPEAVLVADKGVDGTTLTRLDPEYLKPWLERYRLGQLWTSGEIGGTRW